MPGSQAGEPAWGSVLDESDRESLAFAAWEALEHWLMAEVATPERWVLVSLDLSDRKYLAPEGLGLDL